MKVEVASSGQEKNRVFFLCTQSTNLLKKKKECSDSSFTTEKAQNRPKKARKCKQTLNICYKTHFFLEKFGECEKAL